MEAQDDCQNSYDRVADEYVLRIFDELRHKPFDRQLLDRFAASVRGKGPVCDMGCGPGHVARYLHESGIQVSGIDLSPVMVEHANRLTPTIHFHQGDMRALKAEDAAWAGITAFYSIVHTPPCELTRMFSELRRVLQPGGLVLLAFHTGDDTLHLDEWWGQQVCVDFYFFLPAEVRQHLHAAGFEVDEIIEREPYPGVEHQSRRAYVFARRREKDSASCHGDIFA